MRVGISGYELARAEKTGIGMYIRRSVEYLPLCGGEHIFSVYVPRNSSGNSADNPACEWIRLPDPGRSLLWNLLIMPLYLYCNPPDVYFSPWRSLPLLCPSLTVILVPDLAFLVYPDFYTGKERALLKHLTAHGVKRAATIITLSESSKADLLNHYHVDEEKIFVTHLAPGIDIRGLEQKAADLERVRRTYGFGEKYILFVGTLQPQKNISRLIEAFALARKEEHVRDFQLVLAGQKGWFYDSIFHQVERLGLEKEVVFTGYVPQRDLAPLMVGAGAFVFPSLYEGFGIPILDAMACGIPVITSSVSSMPEVAGDAALLVDPKSSSEIAGAIRRLLEDEPLRRDLVQRGYENLKRFSWEKCARETLRAFESAYHSRKRRTNVNRAVKTPGRIGM